jgi:hypothetical protein
MKPELILARTSIVLPSDILETSRLRPGDVMLYRASDLPGYIIAIKTGQDFSHVEGYCGNNISLGARISGVNYYSVRLDKYLVEVRRPVNVDFKPIDAGLSVQSLIGKPYDVPGLFRFFNPWDKHFTVIKVCSVVTVIWSRGGGVIPFNPDVSSDSITPADFHNTTAFKTVWHTDIGWL